MSLLPVLLLSSSVPRSQNDLNTGDSKNPEKKSDQDSSFKNIKKKPPMIYDAYDNKWAYAEQTWDLLWEIGPIDTVMTGIIGVGVAKYAANEKYPEPGQERERNAFRHCYGACTAYQTIGEDALIALDRHEKQGIQNEEDASFLYRPTESCDTQVDQYNNNVAVQEVQTHPDVSCYDFCSEAITSRQLVIVSGRSDSAKDADVEAACNVD